MDVLVWTKNSRLDLGFKESKLFQLPFSLNVRNNLARTRKQACVMAPFAHRHEYVKQLN